MIFSFSDSGPTQSRCDPWRADDVDGRRRWVPIGWWIASTTQWPSPFLKVLVDEGIPRMPPRTRALLMEFWWRCLREMNLPRTIKSDTNWEIWKRLKEVVTSPYKSPLNWSMKCYELLECFLFFVFFKMPDPDDLDVIRSAPGRFRVHWSRCGGRAFFRKAATDEVKKAVGFWALGTASEFPHLCVGVQEHLYLFLQIRCVDRGSRTAAAAPVQQVHRQVFLNKKAESWNAQKMDR